MEYKVRVVLAFIMVSTLIVAVLFQSVWQAVATVVSDVFVTNDPAHRVPVTE